MLGLMGDDLREIARVTDEINKVLIDKNPLYDNRGDDNPFQNINRIEIYHPDGRNQVGYLIDEGGWFGFHFSAVE